MRRENMLTRAYHEYFVRTIVDRYAMWKKKIQKKYEPSSFDMPSHSIKYNRLVWNSYDWSTEGEEWTNDVAGFRGLNPNEWKNALINEMMLKYIKENSMILEVGPGAGRWTKILYPYSKTLILADVSEKCLEICEKSFKGSTNIQYYLVNDRLSKIKENSIDFIWSYDVFVHINPSDIKKYIEDFSHILKPGGIAIIHHSGSYADEAYARNQGFRSMIDKQKFAELVKDNKMTLLEQNESLPHKPGDVITVFSKPN
jgi:ubiquinone/menaquinone biosynthesis C-methylase UbiE